MRKAFGDNLLSSWQKSRILVIMLRPTISWLAHGDDSLSSDLLRSYISRITGRVWKLLGDSDLSWISSQKTDSDCKLFCDLFLEETHSKTWQRHTALSRDSTLCPMHTLGASIFWRMTGTDRTAGHWTLTVYQIEALKLWDTCMIAHMITPFFWVIMCHGKSLKANRQINGFSTELHALCSDVSR